MNRQRAIRTLKRSVLALAVALVGIVAAVALFFGAAIVTSNIVVLALTATVGLLFVAWVLARRVGGRIAPGKRRKAAIVIPLATLLVVAPLASTTIFDPFDFGSVPPGAANDGYWQLETGSRIAYHHYPAENATAEKPPVIILHGGPGVPLRETAREIAMPLTRAGHEVYYYDQLGAGRSTRLDDVREYTVARHVRDLDAVRKQIGAERVVLIGGSWGAQLGAYYTAAHSDHVAKAVLFSPGEIWPPDPRLWGDRSQRKVPHSMLVIIRLESNRESRPLPALPGC